MVVFNKLFGPTDAILFEQRHSANVKNGDPKFVLNFFIYLFRKQRNNYLFRKCNKRDFLMTHGN